MTSVLKAQRKQKKLYKRKRSVFNLKLYSRSGQISKGYNSQEFSFAICLLCLKLKYKNDWKQNQLFGRDRDFVISHQSKNCPITRHKSVGALFAVLKAQVTNDWKQKKLFGRDKDFKLSILFDLISNCQI